MTIIDAQAYVGESIYLKRMFTAEDLLKRMKKNGIDVTVITAPPPAIAQDYYDANKVVYAATEKYKEKLLGFYRLNPWFKEKELERAETAIKEWGFKGFKLNPFHDSYGLTSFDPKNLMNGPQVNSMVKPVMELASKLSIPVFIHTGDSSFCPSDAIPVIASLYPKVNLITELSAADKCLDKNLENIFFGTYPLRGGNKGIDSGLTLTSNFMPDRVIFTTNVPFGFPEFELKVLELTEINNEVKAQIMGENSKTLFNI